MVKNKKKSAYRPRKKPVRHPILLLLFILVFIVGLLWGAKILIDYLTTPPETTENATVEIIPTIRPSQPEPSNQEESDGQTSIPDKTPLKSEGNNPNQSSGLTGSITYLSVDGDKLIIRVNIDQLVGENGTCSLTMSKKGRKDVTKAVNTMDNPASSTCQGFDVPTKELSKGTWSIIINLSAGGKLGKLEGQVEI